MNILHISFTEFRNESRVLKETSSLASHKIFDNIFIAAIWDKGLEKHHIYDNGVVLNRFKLFGKKIQSKFFSQIFQLLEFMVKIVLYYRSKKIDAVGIHNVFLIPVACIFKFFHNTKLIYDTHELETEKNGLGGPRKRLAKILEKMFIHRFDLVFVVGENIADWYQKTYNIKRPTVLFNAPFYKDVKKQDIFRQELSIPRNKKIFLYQGGLMFGRGIELLLDVFSKKQDRIIVFMGYGELENVVKEYAGKFNNIYFYPAVAPDVVLNYTASADIGISFIENICLSYNYCMPNKLFEYAMAGLPAVVSDVKEMGEAVAKYKFGLVAKDGELAGTIDKLLSLNLVDISSNAMNFAKDNSWEKQEQKMIEEYKKLMEKT